MNDHTDKSIKVYRDGPTIRKALAMVVTPEVMAKVNKDLFFFVRKAVGVEIGSKQITRPVTYRAGFDGFVVLAFGRWEAFCALLKLDPESLDRVTCLRDDKPQPSSMNFMLQPWYTDAACNEDLGDFRLWRREDEPRDLRKPTSSLDAGDDEPTNITEAVEQMEENHSRAIGFFAVLKARALNMARCGAYWYSRFQTEQRLAERNYSQGMVVLKELVTTKRAVETWRATAGRRQGLIEATLATNRRLANDRYTLISGFIVMTVFAVVAMVAAVL